MMRGNSNWEVVYSRSLTSSKISRLRNREKGWGSVPGQGDKKTWQLDVTRGPGLGEKKQQPLLKNITKTTDKIWIHCELDCGIVVKTPDSTAIFCLSKKTSLCLRKQPNETLRGKRTRCPPLTPKWFKTCKWVQLQSCLGILGRLAPGHLKTQNPWVSSPVSKMVLYVHITYTHPIAYRHTPEILRVYFQTTAIKRVSQKNVTQYIEKLCLHSLLSVQEHYV